ncbi:MAG: Rne/Rng family ribonuclease [Acidobacteriia bacterium]|nr:Rne/Rng family ribonuclease [Terriglobia bacterium]
MASELLVSRLGGMTWAALREDGATVELRVEREGDRGAVGRIVKGRVTRVLPGIQSAFLDVGSGRDAFLHVGDLMLPGERPSELVPEAELEIAPTGDDDAEESEEGDDLVRGDPRPRPKVRAGPIEDRLREGRELLVQVAREGIGTKGARVTCFVALPGRYLVYMPQLSFRGISRKITDAEERTRLRAVLDALPPSPGGFIVRTAGEGAEETAFRADAAMLRAEWEVIQERAAACHAPSVVHTELDLLLRLLRDAPRQGLDRIVLDDPDYHDRAIAYLSTLAPALAVRVRLHAGPAPLLESFGIDQEIERALRPKVWLRSGGYLVIQQTEALVSIDVNTGKFVGTSRPEETVLRTNLEAAAEIGRQLRLRDLGGIIVVDFIDMESPENRKQVLDALEAALRRDRARTKVVGLSELGLVQLTRKRTRPGVAASLTRSCPLCGGHGRVKAPETLAREALSEVLRLLPGLEEQAVVVRVHPDVASALRIALETAGPLLLLTQAARVRIEEDPGVRPDRFDVLAL